MKRLKKLGLMTLAGLAVYLIPAFVSAAAITPVCGPSDTEGTVRCTWRNMANGDIGVATETVNYTMYSDRSAQVAGTFGSGGTISIKGSIDGSNMEILSDAQGNAITLTASGLKFVTELTRYVQPQVTAGDGTTLLTVNLFMKRLK